MLSALATLVFALAAMAPGVALCGRAKLDTACLAAAAVASLVISMLATALLGVALYHFSGMQLPAAALLPVSLVLLLLAIGSARRHNWAIPRLEWSALAPVLFAAIYSAAIYSISITEMPNGSLRVHAWYNADWFKHIGHTFAIADYGLPARDIFGNGQPLHYYWLSYVLPGAGTAIGGNAWTALYVSNFVYSSALWLTFYGLIRSIGIQPLPAAISVIVASIVTAPLETGFLMLMHGIDTLLYNNVAPVGPPFLSFALYIPQHALALSLFLGWATIVVSSQTSENEVLRRCALGGMSALLVVSSLFGAALLFAYGLFELFRRQFSAILELFVMAIISGALVLLLGVIQLDHANSALESPALANWSREGTTFDHAVNSLVVVLKVCGLPLLMALFLFHRWPPKTETEKRAKAFGILLCIITFALAILIEVIFEPRIAQEIRIRIINLPVIGICIVGSFYFANALKQGRRTLLKFTLATVLLIILAMPSATLRSVWHGNQTDRYTTVIPAADRQVLSKLRERSSRLDRVWQYPEKPYMSDFKSRDSWSVVLAGRTNVGTERATDYAAAYPDIQRAYRYFSGEDVPVPTSVDWIYLSRALHPESFDALRDRLGADIEWTQRDCYPDACIFSRRASQAAAQ